MYIGILDDNLQFVKILQEELAQFGEHEYRIYHSISQKMLDEQFDILFLDVMLDGKESFDFGEAFSLKNPAVTLVYISSMDHFVYDSIYQTSFFFVRKSDLNFDLSRLFEKYNTKIISEKETLEFTANKCKEIILQKDIISIVSRKNSITIVTHNQKYLVYKTLKYIYELLNKNNFYRLNSYTILNFNHIDKITSNIITLDNEEKIYFSKGNRGAFMRAYSTFKREKLWDGK